MIFEYSNLMALLRSTDLVLGIGGTYTEKWSTDINREDSERQDGE